MNRPAGTIRRSGQKRAWAALMLLAGIGAMALGIYLMFSSGSIIFIGEIIFLLASLPLTLFFFNIIER